MAVSAVVNNGKIEETQSESSVKKAASKTGMDKDAFLQLLVAQMKYQDPLEPTSNTEYISQLATFSSLEEMQNLNATMTNMQNMAATMELTRASSMVGKLVAVETTDKSGDVKQLQGMVQYVTYENGKAYVSIEGNLYSADDVTAVIDETYQTAFDLAVSFVTALDQLPRVERLTIADKESVDALQKAFNAMTAYQQSFISDEYIEKLQKYVAKMAELVEMDESNNGDTDTDTDTDGTEGEGDTEPTEPTE